MESEMNSEDHLILPNTWKTQYFICFLWSIQELQGPLDLARYVELEDHSISLKAWNLQ